MDYDAIWYGGRPRPKQLCVRRKTSSPPKKEAEPPPQFSANVHCGQTVGCQDTTWCGGRPQPRRHCLRWGHSSTFAKGEQPPFSANDRCGQTAGWTKMPLGMASAQATLCLMETQLPHRKKWNITHPIFGQCLLWPNGWMDEYATLYGSRPRPRPHYVRRGPSSPAKGAQQPRPSFRPMSIVATVAHLSYC